MSEGAGKRGLAWQTSQKDAQEPEKSLSDSVTEATKEQESDVDSETRNDASIKEKILLQQASKFLGDPSVADAPIAQKIAFLESKGISKADIQKVLDITEKDSSPPKPQPIAPSNRYDEVSPAVANAKTQEIPPIITYPEFLMKPQKPPPIITASRLLNTAYAFGGAATIIYGLSKYLIAPMTDSLTFARHEFAGHGQKQIDELNAKLKEIVTLDFTVYRDLVAKPGDDAASVVDSLDSDPTEVYHRDFGTQTLPLSTRSETSSSDNGDETKDVLQGDSINNQASQLLQMKSRLEELRSEYDVDEQSTYAEISAVMKVLNDHLESLAYPTSSYHGVYGGNEGGKKDDEVGRIKAEIRGVKGVLLSARNFRAPARGAFAASTAR